MKLSKKEVEHIASLARIKLSSEEKEKFATQLSSILEYFDKLKEVDTSQVKPTFQITDLSNIMARDRINPFREVKNLLKNAPEIQDNFIKIKSVLE